jgi:hypothetical protein
MTKAGWRSRAELRDSRHERQERVPRDLGLLDPPLKLAETGLVQLGDDMADMSLKGDWVAAEVIWQYAKSQSSISRRAPKLTSLAKPGEVNTI